MTATSERSTFSAVTAAIALVEESRADALEAHAWASAQAALEALRVLRVLRVDLWAELNGEVLRSAPASSARGGAK